MAEPADAVLMPLLAALERLMSIQRYLHPALLAQLAAGVPERETPLLAARKAWRSATVPAAIEAHRAGIDTAFELTAKALAALRAMPGEPEGIYSAYRALRYLPYAMEALYPVAAVAPPVSGFFLEPGRREDGELLARLAAGAGHDDTGVFHVDNERDSKGGYSVYVPETCDPAAAHPVVFALHGGTGHGRAFLWSWVREARGRGVIVVSPTARGDTWSLMGPDIDSANLEAMLAAVSGRWPVDRDRLLLTGMSDGGTFSYVSGLRRASPFSHLAPVAASFHPVMLHMIEEPAIAGRRIYLTHGAQDWMFDVEVARQASELLAGMGAAVVYREIPDLSHTYPRDENPRILDWLLG